MPFGTHSSPNGSSGTVATDTIWDAAGDLAVGSGADTAAKLAKGSALQRLRVNAAATGLEWANPQPYNTPWHSYYNGFGYASDTVIASSFSADRIIGSWLLVTDRITVTALTIHVTTAGTALSTARLGIFSHPGGNIASQTATRVLDAGTVAIDSTGTKTIGSLTQDLDPGLYLAVINHNSVTALGVRRYNLSDIAAIDVSANTAVEAVGVNPSAFGAFPASFTAVPVGTSTGAGRASFVFATASLR